MILFMAQNPMKNQAFRRHNQRGSAIIYIFIFIALFGALIFTMSKGMRTGAGSLTDQQAKLAATEILSYADTVRGGVKKLLIDGTQLEKISFQMDERKTQANAPITNYLPNPACTNDTCRLFKPTGGGVKETHFWQYGVAAPSWPSNYLHAGGLEFAMLDVKGLGTSLPEIVLKVNQVQKDICTAFNNLMGLPEAAALSITPGKTFYHATVANYKVTNAHDAGYNSDSYLLGKMAFCDNNDRIIFLVAVVQ